MKKSHAAKKVIFVTGASRGMGYSILERFKEKNWITIGCSSRKSSTDPLAKLADLRLTCDVADPNQVARAVQEITKKYGKIDVLVNNAGIAGSNSMDVKASKKDSDELWHRIIDVNLHGTYYVTKACIPLIKTAGRSGRIINISSVLGLKGVPDATAYCAAKHAVIGFTRSLAHYLGPDGITVNALCPGWTRTEMAQSRMKAIGMSEKDLGKALPMGRMAEPEEIAFLVEMIADSKSQSVTGQTLTVDGGFLA